MGMLFFCLVSAHDFPEILYTSGSKKVLVEDLGTEIVKRDDLSIPRGIEVNKVRLNHRTYECIGYFFNNPAWTDQKSVGYYCHLSKENKPIFKNGNIFYFQELERKVIWHKRDKSADTDYDSDDDSCTTTEELLDVD